MVRLLADPVLIAAVVLALYNNLVNLLPQHLHDQVYVPLNLIAGLLDLARDCDAGAASGQRHFCAGYRLSPEASSFSSPMRRMCSL